MNIESYVQNHPKLNLKSSAGGSEYRGWCPFQGSSGEYDCFSINVTSGMWLCRSSRCGLRGSFPLFYKMLEGLTDWRRVRDALQIDGKRPLQGQADLQALLTTDSKEAPPIPPFPGVLPLTKINPYLAGRKFDERLFDTGFDFWINPTDRFYCHRLILPYYNLLGEYQTFTSRTMLPKVEPRYFHGSKSMGAHLYGIHRAAHLTPKRIWVVEGQFDAIRLAYLGEFPLCISGSSASPRQLLDIRSLAAITAAPVVVCLDNLADKAQQTLWGELISLGVKSIQVRIGDIAKDPGELSQDGLQQMLDTVDDLLRLAS